RSVAESRRLRGRGGGGERALRRAALLGGRESATSVPRDPGQAGEVQADYLLRQLAGFSVRATAESGDKTTRAGPVAAQAEAGNIRLLRGPWNEAFLEEVALFPNGAHDDQVDALSRAFAALVEGGRQVQVFA